MHLRIRRRGEPPNGRRESMGRRRCTISGCSCRRCRGSPRSCRNATSGRDIEVAAALADVATSYMVNASKQRQREQLSEQLHGISVDQAFHLMRAHARSNSASLRTVAEAIVAVGLQVGARRSSDPLPARESLGCTVRIAASPRPR